MNRADIEDLYCSDEPDILFADGYDEASEYFDFNIAGSNMGVYTPLYLET